MVQSDNRLVVAYITKQEGTKSLRLLLTTHRILELASRYQINLVARYLPGRYNDTADGLSRSKELTEWTLSQEILQVIFKKMGTPEVDLFATIYIVDCSKYDIEEESMKLYGVGYKTVLLSFRQTPEYVKILQDKHHFFILMESSVKEYLGYDGETDDFS
ncbi:putative transposon Ty3-I Gag-Pol polyprotein, partial [Operophtera brumata]